MRRAHSRAQLLSRSHGASSAERAATDPDTVRWCFDLWSHARAHRTRPVGRPADSERSAARSTTNWRVPNTGPLDGFSESPEVIPNVKPRQAHITPTTCSQTSPPNVAGFDLGRLADPESYPP